MSQGGGNTAVPDDGGGKAPGQGDKDNPLETGNNDNPLETGNNDNTLETGNNDNPLESGKRDRKLTEKGKQFLVGNCKTLLKSLSKRLDRQITLISPLLLSTNNDVVDSEVVQLDRIYTEYTEAYARFGAMLDEETDSEDHTAANINMDEVDSKYFGLKEQIIKWQLVQEQKRDEDSHSIGSRSRSSSGSRKSRRSNNSKASLGSTNSDKSLRLKAKVAGLKAEAEAIKKTKEAELALALRKNEEKIRKAEAMERVYTESLEGEGKNLEEVKNKEPVAPTEKKEKKRRRSTSMPELTSIDMQVALMEMMKLQCAPKPDLDEFSGNPLEYCYFKASFRDVVESTVPDQRGRLTRLIKYTRGEPKELIKHLVHADPQNCYDKAVELLDHEYGNPHILSCSYIKELRQWEPIKQNDAAAYKKFYRFLLKCQAYKLEHQLNELDSTDMLRTVILKVHQSLQDRWNRKVHDTRRRLKREVDFSDIVKFIEMQATLMSDPAYSRDALSEASKQLKTNVTQFTEIPGKNVTFEEKACPLCSSSHDLEDCQDFLAKGIDDRHKTVFQLRLCFSCLEPTSEEHQGKSCTRKRKCKVCSDEHPTTLHGGKSLQNRHTTLPYKVVAMCIVQVELWHKDSPERRMTVYALFDECSQGTFIKDDILEQLDIQNSPIEAEEEADPEDPEKDIPNIKTTTIRVDTAIGSKEAQSLQVKGLMIGSVPSHAATYGKAELKLPLTYSREHLAVSEDEIPTPASVRPWKHLESVASKLPEYDPNIPIGLMIGSDCPKANEPHETIPSESDGPYAKRLKLGWSVIGPINKHIRNTVIKSNCTKIVPVQDVSTGEAADHVFAVDNRVQDTWMTNMLREMYFTEFNEARGETMGLSVEDEKFLTIMEDGILKNGQHYQLPLPFRNKEVRLPYNKSQATSRLSTLKRKFLADGEYKIIYDKFMNNLIKCCYARRADTSKDVPGRIWFVPHFGVYNPKKGKLRVVFDFSARFKGRCLNDELIQGPNLANLMLGVLLRYRREEVAYMADIEAMFHQVQVPDEQVCFLRFLYWPDGQLDKDPVEYEMCVHPFGAVSSGSCANFALKRTAVDEKEKFGREAASSLIREFYVDDHLHSKPDVISAKIAFSATREMCAQGGFNLNKLVSNSRELMEQVPSECVSPIIDLSLSKQHLPIERPLGVGWCLEDDSLEYHITFEDKPLNRRGALATISSVHDPSGLAGPFILPGRKILQEITLEKGGWDDDLPTDKRAAWEKWRIELRALSELKIPRCYKPKGFKAVSCSLHSFSDASDYGYGEATYLRQVSESNEVCVSLVMAKSRVVPSKQTTIPRMELVAALVAANVTALVKDELDMLLSSETYWIDSMIALGYIQNDVKRFRTFVANRRRKIRMLTDQNRWKKVDTKENPADSASRGLSIKDTKEVERWFNGPKMLWELDDPSLRPAVQAEVPDDDPEVVITVKSNAVVVEDSRSVLRVLESRVSRWCRMKSIVAWCLLFISKCRKTSKGKCTLQAEDIQIAEITILKLLQQRHFASEVSLLQRKKELLRSSKIIKLNPWLDTDGLLRVGGRLKKSSLETSVKHPIILPKKEVVPQRIIEHYHREIEHVGRTSTLGEIRSQGYWVINGMSQVDKVIQPCALCRGLRRQPEGQKTADLPEKRTIEAPPFTYCGSDCFGPFIIKEGRKELKRYGVIFTCFGCRAVHIETVTSMNTDSFILALRRFIARRGPVRSIRSDNGGNYVGVEGELKQALKEMDREKIAAFLLKNSCDWIEWEKNPPTASHMGGVWERQIRSVRNVLSSSLHTHAARLNDESLRTLLVEVEAIVNSRPLAVDTLTDQSIEPITPNHLLTMKSKVVFPPPGVFQKADVYCRKRWRAVQFLANEFWRRWRQEYLQIMQERKTENVAQRNIQVNDVVLVVDGDLPRNKWPMARVVETFPSSDGLVRHVSVKMSGSNIPLKRPVVKLILLLEATV